MKLLTILVSLLFCFSTTANAYIGPGMGLGAIITLLGIIGAILVSILAIIYYPIKRLFIKLKKNKKNKKME